MGNVRSALHRMATACGLPSIRSLLTNLVLITLGVAFSVAGALVLIEDKPPGIEPASLLTTVLLIVPMLLILLVRRRFPLSVLTVSTSLLTVVRLLDVPELQVTSVAWVIALYSAGRYGGQYRTLLRAVVIVAMIALLLYDVISIAGDVEAFGLTQRAFALTAGSNVGWNLVVFVGAWIAGDLARNRYQRERELAARTLELEVSQEENARRAVMDERVRIAREIHDVVAHHVSLMGVQAGAARRALVADPDRAEAPLRSIEDSSREAVNELHRLLGFLRRVDDLDPDPDGLDPEALAPRPRLERLPELRRQLADAGLALRLTVVGDERSLPPSVDLNAFRILQEALTNTLKYAGVDSADVILDYRQDRLELTVSDRGRGPVEPIAADNRSDGAGVGSIRAGSGGAGLIGMAERVALLGGSLTHGARSGGGFEVRAVLPYEGVVTPAPSASSVEKPVEKSVPTW